jgi:hypothetical protein
MGCDIHLHTEVKINGVWHHYGAPCVDRNYRVFAKMADVRNSYSEIEPIAQPRGIPGDATEMTKFDCERWGRDGHSHSWLSAEEIAILYHFINDELRLKGWRVPEAGWWPEDNFGYFFGNTWGGFWEYRDHANSGTPKGVEDVRFVFWFDC